MSRAYVKELSDGTRKGNARGPLRCQREGWLILGGDRCELRYAPRNLRDCRPWTDGVARYRALDCWAVPPHRLSKPAK